MHKLVAIAYYEILMAWRRRSLPILWLVLVFIGVAFSLLTAQSSRPAGTIVINVVGADVHQAAAEIGLPVDMIVLTRQQISHSIFIALIFSIAMILLYAEMIPLDRQFRVRELLDTLPVSPTTYLGGKMIGVLLMISLILLSGGALIFGVWRVLLGTFDGRVLLILWLVMVLPICGTVSILTVLTAAFWSTRRRAVLFALALMPAFAVLILGSGFQLAYVSALAHPVYVSVPARTMPVSEILLRIGAGWMLLLSTLLIVWWVVWMLSRHFANR